MNQPVGEVDMGGAGFGGGVLFEEVADFEVEVWEVGGAAEPIVAGVYVGEGYVVPDVSVVPHYDWFTNKFTNTFWFFLMNSPIPHFRLKC